MPVSRETSRTSITVSRETSPTVYLILPVESSRHGRNRPVPPALVAWRLRTSASSRGAFEGTGVGASLATSKASDSGRAAFRRRSAYRARDRIAPRSIATAEASASQRMSDSLALSGCMRMPARSIRLRHGIDRATSCQTFHKGVPRETLISRRGGTRTISGGNSSERDRGLVCGGVRVPRR